MKRLEESEGKSTLSHMTKLYDGAGKLLKTKWHRICIKACIVVRVETPSSNSNWNEFVKQKTIP
ncbi:hypothetical protein T4A_4933 [Trichinella pseudospiralis]|uniref:Uncharacterized protein n=1 Tax=Trichinella pseudospiralis TaxID=6337 RepID=A0A0V1DJ22_TRIPS|nr:hypothetical protein T4A_4933 [Trichinella pseudospiralis]